ncbi:MAG: PhoH family protein [Gammaproteobacteria bacterium]|nr:PhoH family protein [Gammaproteobacteria bacterium]
MTLDTNTAPHQVTLEPIDSQQLANLCGPFDSHLRQIETRLGITINNRGNDFQLIGNDELVVAAGELLGQLASEVTSGVNLTSDKVHLFLQESGVEALSDAEVDGNDFIIATRKKSIKPRGRNQIGYIRAIRSNDINFGVGPAGTGKTYLAVACAVEALEQEQVRRILLVRPAVEAGEKLGFLPGDLSQKIDPYLRPLYDALYEMLGFERVEKLIEKNVIEVAPLAYMRGRTLNDSYIILDESQNTTVAQLKMFLTRVGFGSTVVVTGDITQIDLPNKTMSGLRHVLTVLKDINGISFTHFSSRDVVRHPLVQRIVEAYDRSENG